MSRILIGLSSVYKLTVLPACQLDAFKRSLKNGIIGVLLSFAALAFFKST